MALDNSLGQSKLVVYRHWPFLVGAIVFWQIQPTFAYLVLIFVIWAFTQLFAQLRAQAQTQGISVWQSMNIIAVLFFCSGFSAIIYQIVWQRTLFTMFGSDQESVTIIVSVFMFGLGVGAFAGNYLLRFRGYLLHIFLAIEVLIGLFGFFSLPIAHYIQTSIEINNQWLLILAAYALFAFPTLLMGATLPILVAYLNQRYQNIGRSSGFLYAANTWGSAFAAFISVLVIFSLTGQQGATWIAALFNILTAVAIYRAAPFLQNVERDTPAPPSARHLKPMPVFLVLLLSFSIGYITLSQELIWYRLLGITSGGDPRIFGLLLGCVLLGIGTGSYRVKQACERGDNVQPLVSSALFIAAIISFLTIPAVSLAAAASARGFGVAVGFAAIGAIAYFTGFVLPALSTLCATTDSDKNSRQLGWIYAVNIFGATLGPVATGYILFDKFPFEVISVAYAVVLLFLTISVAERKTRQFGLATIACALFAASYYTLHDGAIERIQFEKFGEPEFAHRMDTRSSLITATTAPGGLLVHGGGAYDGRINTDPIINSNGIDRAYIIPTLHPNPQKILEIGLSSGAWAKVVAMLDGLNHLTSVEINRGYLQLIAKVPLVAPILNDPKISIAIDDGRRWLRRNPHERFDFILMNTTLHWRSQATNLLSVEFFRLCKTRLADGGVVYFNTTGSEDAAFTAAQVFPHIVRYGSFVAASDRPFAMSSAEKHNNLLRLLTPSGSAYFKSTPELQKFHEKLSGVVHHDVGEQYRLRTDLRMITDDNMLTEFKR